MTTLRRICVTGPECTGKTTLALELARELRAEWVPESSRMHFEEVGRALTADDVEPIARAHITLADAAIERSLWIPATEVVFDTDLVSTVVYAKHYYGACPQWIEEAATARLADLYFLCDIDVPWVADGVRDRPDHRRELLASFEEELRARGANVVRITGDWATRWAVTRREVHQ